MRLLISACAGKPQEQEEEDDDINRLWAGGEIYVQCIINVQLTTKLEDLNTDSLH